MPAPTSSRLLTILVPALVAVLLASACGTDGDSAGTGLPLEGTPWRLTEVVQDGALTAVPDEVSVTALFDDGELSGSGGCNRYSAGYAVDGSALQIQPVASTLIACPEPASSVETAFLAALERARSYQTDQTALSLSDEAGEVVLRFTEGEQASLADTTWSATGVNNGREAVVSLVPGSQITAVFSDETVSGSAGCNTYRGGAVVDGDRVTVGPLATTRKLCPGVEGLDAQETQFLAAMERATTWRIEGTALELRDDEGALQVSFEDAGPTEG